jgi:hypothetical protein
VSEPALGQVLQNCRHHIVGLGVPRPWLAVVVVVVGMAMVDPAPLRVVSVVLVFSVMMVLMVVAAMSSLFADTQHLDVRRGSGG